MSPRTPHFFSSSSQSGLGCQPAKKCIALIRIKLVIIQWLKIPCFAKTGCILENTPKTHIFLMLSVALSELSVCLSH